MKVRFSILFILFGFAVLAQNDCIPPRPNKLVNDYTETTLTGSQIAALERKLVAYNDTTSTQITVVIMRNICGEEINFFTAQLGEEWGVGQGEADNGCVVLLSMDDHKVAIQNGYGLEEYLTDAMSRRIIENVMIPHFKKDEYYEGLNDGTTAIFQLLAGKFEGTGPHKDYNGPPVIVIIFIVLLIIFLASRGGGKGNRGYRGGGGYWIGGFGGGSLGGGGGFSGGGGFGGFGGGSFGGGGASGSW